MALPNKTNTKTPFLFYSSFLIVILIAILTRFIGLTQFPPSLYWEEAALGYDAYSILKTARDHHGNFLPIIAFESFGDFKPSFYFYSLVPSIAIFGLTDFAVRLPSAASGVLSVVLIGLIAREVGYTLTKKQIPSEKNLPQLLQIMTMSVASLNPWAIQFSRGGWEVNEATMLLTLGLYLQLRIRRKIVDEGKSILKEILQTMILSVVLTALSLYTYHATRVIAPVLLGIFWIDILLELWLSTKHKSSDLAAFLKKRVGLFLIAGILFTALISPVLISLKSSQTQQRFAETSLFADGRQVTVSNQLIANSNPKWLGKIVYHRYLISVQMIIENYSKHFSFSFLFLNGDKNPRHSVQFVGLFYTGEAVLLLIGLFFAIKNRNPVIYLLILWLLVGVLPAALTTATPHALRILPSMPVWICLLGFGIFQIWTWSAQLPLQKNVRLVLLFSCFVIFYGWQFASFWRFYSLIYPKQYAGEWQYGYKQMVEALVVNQNQRQDLPVQVSREYGRPAMYYWFYSHANPMDVQSENASALKDQGEFLSYKHVTFVDQVHLNQKSLVASSEKTYQAALSAGSHVQKLNEISEPSGKIVWVVYEIQ